MDKKTMREQGFFIIPTEVDGWNMITYEVFVKNELIGVYRDRSQAYEKLEHERDKHQIEELDLDK